MLTRLRERIDDWVSADEQERPTGLPARDRTGHRARIIRVTALALKRICVTPVVMRSERARKAKNDLLEFVGNSKHTNEKSMSDDDNEADESPRFSPGDVVMLRSGGPKMTVANVQDSGSYPIYNCEWFDRETRELNDRPFRERTLTKVDRHE